MAKFYGTVGYVSTQEVRPGVFLPNNIVEKKYYGDLIRNNRRLETTDKVNDDINISNQISIVADPFAYQNFHNIRYIEFMSTKWKVINVDVQYPRLVLSVGGVYSEDEGDS